MALASAILTDVERYFIGSGAILEAGERSKIIGASVHAQLTSEELPQVVLIDFESPSLADVRQLLAVASGYSIASFDVGVASRLLAAGECGFDDVVQILAQATGVPEVHLYARWAPDEAIVSGLAAKGVRLAGHPLEQISRAALIAQHRYQAWGGGLRAA